MACSERKLIRTTAADLVRVIDRLQRFIVAMVRIDGIAGAKGFTPDVRSRVGETVRQPPRQLEVHRLVGGVIVVAVDVDTRVLRVGNQVVVRKSGMAKDGPSVRGTARILQCGIQRIQE